MQGPSQSRAALPHSLPLFTPGTEGPYIYKPLSAYQDEIRIIEVQPGSFDDPVRLKLHHTPFETTRHRNDIPDHQRAPSEGPATAYEALSYVWGDATDLVPVYFHDASITRSLDITYNCEQALRYLRRPENARMVWIDAICINQANLEERADQVRLMFAIYSQAVRVIVWLGPASDDSHVAMNYIEHIGSLVTVDPVTEDLRSLKADDTLLRSGLAIASDEEWHALHDFFRRPYWERLWVWNEIRAGSARTVLQCGHMSVIFYKFVRTVLYLNRKSGRASMFWADTLPRLHFIQQFFGGAGALDVSHLLNTLRTRICTDQRDRVYSANTFADMRRSLDIIPNYKLPVETIYQHYVLASIKKHQKLDFLRYAGLSRARQGIDTFSGLPSWVPDWSVPPNLLELEGNNTFASGASSAAIVAAGSNGLLVRGSKIGTVTATLPFGRYSLLSHTVEQLLVGLQNLLAGLDRTLRRQEGIAARLAKVLSAGLLAASRIPPRREWPTLLDFEAIISASLQHDYSVLPIESMRRCLSIMNRLSARSLLVIDDEIFGIGPDIMEEGDILAVVLGFDLAVAVRAVQVQDQLQSAAVVTRYRYLGECICDGFMSGEAFLGTLPQGLHSVMVRNDAARIFAASVQNTATGMILADDPRLPPLPQQWESVHLGDWPEVVAGPGFRNVETGELRLKSQDPRMDADALGARGVALHTFHLV